MPRHTDEERAEFEAALQSIAEEGTIPTPQLDALSMLEGEDLERYRQVWSKLAAPARARLVRALHDAALQRLRVDYSAINRLALDDPEAVVRLAGVQSAIEDNSPALMDTLLRLVRSDPVGEIRWAATEDLARFALRAELEDIDSERTTNLKSRLWEIVHDGKEEPRVRGAALAALGYFSDDETMQQLGTAFTTPVLRLGAVRGMGRSADPRWTDRLMPVLGSEDAQMRLEAARALGEIEDERAVTPLLEVVDDPELDVRLAVLEALGRIGGEEAREALLYAAEDDEERVREAAERALQELEETEADPLEF